MVDAVHLVVSMKAIPSSAFVGMNDGARRDMRTDSRDASGFRRGDCGKGLAATLTSHDHGLTLAGMFLGQAAVLPVGLLVLLPGVAAEIGAVDFDRAGKGEVAWFIDTAFRLR